MKKLKLYVWEDVLTDYTPGIMFALAENIDQARDLIRKSGNILESDLAGKPNVYSSRIGFALWGGG